MIDKEPDLDVVADSGLATDVTELVDRYKPDVLLLDVHMEGTTFNLVKKARAGHPDLKVLFITAFDTKENAQKAARFGALGLVSKLEGNVGICTALRAVSKGERYFSEPEVRPRGLRGRQGARSKTIPSHHPLSPREVDILCCVAHAMTAKEIARDLHISVKTVIRNKNA